MLDRLLTLHGLVPLGAGDAAFVFLNPASPLTVVKVGLDMNDGWPAWAAWCRDHPSPHVPRIEAFTWLSDGAGQRRLYASVVERLWPFPEAREWLAPDRLLKRDPSSLSSLIRPRHPGVAAMLLEAESAFPGVRWDMAPSNWLRREDGTVVLMDPLAHL